MTLPAVRTLSDEQREAAAMRVHDAYDFALPRLRFWNYELCDDHKAGWIDPEDPDAPLVTDRPMPGCRRCGLHFRRHQRVGIAWLYLKKRALLADTVGSGKTSHAGGLIAAIKEAGELARGERVVVCCRATAVMQWRDELARMLPNTSVIVAVGSKRARMERYSGAWEVLLIGPEMLRNDHAVLDHFQISTLIVDDVDALRNRTTRTAYVLKRLGRRADRMVIMSGTPLQKRLDELHSVLDAIGGLEVFGNYWAFMRRYLRTEKVTIYTTRGRKQTIEKIVGVKNVSEFIEKIRPMALRRTADDIDDVELPSVVPNTIPLELHPSQRARYDQLREEVVTLLNGPDGPTVKHAAGIAKLHYASKICGGIATLEEDVAADGPGASAKLDWLMEQLEGDWSEEKVVVFMHYKASIRAFQVRARAAGIGHVTIWSEQSDKNQRAADVRRFWDDPSCRVLVGTTAIEQSLNLQCARHLVNYDQILNPARMEQLAGRVKRDGSAWKTVYVHNPIMQDTHEPGLLRVLSREQALLDRVWGESSELFEALDPRMVLQLITD